MKVFTLLYNNFNVIDSSLMQLRITSHLPLEIIALDNHYPGLTKDAKQLLKEKFDLTIYDEGENLGLSAGYNYLINKYPEEKHVILYDCDSYPITHGWDKAIQTALQDNKLAYCSLVFEVCEREFKERGFKEWQTSTGIRMITPSQACVQSVSGADLDYIRQIGMMQEPKKYYGGFEGKMFNYWNELHRIGYLKDFREYKEYHNRLEDNRYTSYKYAYAHKDYQYSFDEYLINK